MSVSRREFVSKSSLAAAALVVPAGWGAGGRPAPLPRSTDPQAKLLCMLALDAARTAGAEYADARVVRYRQHVVLARADRIERSEEVEDFGFAVRVLAGGVWGFASGQKLLRQESFRLARAAVEDARSGGRPGGVTLAPVPADPDGDWKTPILEDPFAVSLDDKAALLLDANGEALRIGRVQRVESAIECQRIEMTFASTAGSIFEQVTYRTYPWMAVTAGAAGDGPAAVRRSWEIAPMALGWEHVRDADLVGQAGGWAQEAAEALSAKPVEAGVYDLILHPSHLARVVHETVGRATALDRVMSGTSFLAPPGAVVDTFRLGPEFLNIQGDRTQRGAAATVGWDDEGVPADAWPLVTDGVVVEDQTTRASAGEIAAFTGVRGSHGCAVADSWQAPPVPRMPNVSLLPGEEDHSIDDLIAGTDRGILIKGPGQYALDDQCHDFRFAGQGCYEIRNGTVVGMLRNVVYEGTTPEFWNALDMIGGSETYELSGVLYDGYAGTGRVMGCGHGAPAARFRGIRVLNLPL
jgi:TldD protein